MPWSWQGGSLPALTEGPGSVLALPINQLTTTYNSSSKGSRSSSGPTASDTHMVHMRIHRQKCIHITINFEKAEPWDVGRCPFLGWFGCVSHFLADHLPSPEATSSVHFLSSILCFLLRLSDRVRRLEGLTWCGCLPHRDGLVLFLHYKRRGICH